MLLNSHNNGHDQQIYNISLPNHHHHHPPGELARSNTLRSSGSDHSSQNGIATIYAVGNASGHVNGTQTLMSEQKEHTCLAYLLYICQVQNQYLSRLITSNQMRIITLDTNWVCKSSRKLKNLSCSWILDPGLIGVPEPAGTRGSRYVGQFYRS